MQIARTSKQLGHALRRQRHTLALSQTAVGEQTTLRQATISAAEAGASGTTLKTIFTLLAELDLELVGPPRHKDKRTEESGVWKECGHEVIDRVTEVS